MKGDKKQSAQPTTIEKNGMLRHYLLMWTQRSELISSQRNTASWDWKKNLYIAATILHFNWRIFFSTNWFSVWALGHAKSFFLIIFCLDKWKSSHSTGAIYINGQGDKRPISLSYGFTLPALDCCCGLNCCGVHSPQSTVWTELP